MKFATVLAASALAVVSAQQECPTTTLVGIVAGTNGAACTAATNYSPATLTIPTGEQLKTVCSTGSCKALLQEISAAVPTECLFNGKLLKATIIDKFPGECEKALGTASNNSTAASNSTSAPTNGTATPGTTTVAPETTTQTPSTTTEAPMATPAPSSNSTGSGNGTDGASPSTDGSVTKGPSGSVPAPGPTGGVSHLSALVGVVVATIVAAML